MDMTPVTLPVATALPYFSQQAQQIVRTVRENDDIAGTMHVSNAIAERVKVMYKQWGEQTKPSIYAYRGDVYKGFYADTLASDDLVWAQQHIWVMSGLYGALRPLDEISQYRLEMKANLPVKDAKNLYVYWGDRLAQYIDEHANGVICVLSSDEYARPVTRNSRSRIVTPVFMDHKPNGNVGPVPIYSKMMRGVMARWIIDHRIERPEDLSGFNGFDYHYDASRSTTDKPVFVRASMTPLIF